MAIDDPMRPRPPAPAAGRHPVSRPGHPPDAHPPLPDPRGGHSLPGAPTPIPPRRASSSSRRSPRSKNGPSAQLDGSRGGGRASWRGRSSATPALDPVAPPTLGASRRARGPPAPGPFHDVAIDHGRRPDARPRPSPSTSTPSAGLAPLAEPASPARIVARTGSSPTASGAALTEEQSWTRIRLEARREPDRPRVLEAWKPRRSRRIGGSPRRSGRSISSRSAPGRGEAGPVPRELRKLMRGVGDRAGPQINGLCERIRPGHHARFNAVETRLRRHPRGSDGDKVEMMRSSACPSRSSSMRSSPTRPLAQDAGRAAEHGRGPGPCRPPLLAIPPSRPPGQGPPGRSPGVGVPTRREPATTSQSSRLAAERVTDQPASLHRSSRGHPCARGFQLASSC